MNLEPRPIRIHEVGPRDGFQSEAQFIATDDKVALIDALSATGLAKIEATSFTSPRAIPQLADAGEVMARIRRVPGTIYSALVPNVRGAERALEAKVDEVNVVVSISEAHNLANIRQTREQSLAGITEILSALEGGGVRTVVSVSTAFGCGIAGPVSQEEVLLWADRIAELGVDGLNICDTVGAANPRQVAGMVREATERFGGLELSWHFHDTRALALPNVLAAIDAGAERFESSFGGIGGCPYAPGATGNACTEDVVYMLEASGFATGVDLDALAAAAGRLPGILGHDVPSHFLKAGRAPGQPREAA